MTAPTQDSTEGYTEAYAADQHRDAVTAADIDDHVAGEALELGDRGRRRDLLEVEQVVRDAAPLGLGKLGRADVHAAVDLHRIGVDHLAA